MKQTKTLIILIAAISALSLQSCLKDQQDYFEEPASERLHNYLNRLQSILISKPEGWVMEYYPGTGQSHGGYTYHVIFNAEGEVTVRSELKPGESEQSNYKLCSDNGAVLSFDTNNGLFHYFATPSSAHYEALGGDFEFSVLDISDDKVTLIGKRSHNLYTLIPFAYQGKPDDYMDKVYYMANSVKAATVEGKIGNLDVTGEVNLNNRCITFHHAKTEAGDTLTRMPFRYTPEGIKAYVPLNLGGCTFQDFAYLEKNNLLTNGVFTLTCKVPENYTEYDYFIGDFTLNYYSSSVKVTFTPNEDRTGFMMSGLNSHFDVSIQYDKAKGALRWNVQTVGSHGSNAIVLCAWDSVAGYLTWLENIGVIISRNLKTGVFEFADNKEWEDYAVDSFILYEFDSSGGPLDEYTGWGNGEYPMLTSLTKIE